MSETALRIIVVVVVVAAALGLVLRPMIRRGRRPAADALPDEKRIEARIHEYRTALEADTVCDRCLQANSADAAFCASCGRPLGATP